MSGCVASLTVLTFGIFSRSGVSEQHLFFNTRGAAEAALNKFHDSRNMQSAGYVDDYGTTLDLPSGGVSFVRLSDMEKTMEVQVEQNLLQARAQARMQQRAAQDPVLSILNTPANAAPKPGFRPTPVPRP